MNISSTTDGETSFTLRIHKTSNRRTISAHKTRKGRTKEIVYPSFKTSTIPNIPNMPNIHCHHIIDPEKEAKCVLSPILDSNNNYKDDRYIVLPRDKKRNKVTFADQIKTVTVLPVIVQSVNESANIESIHKDKDKEKDKDKNSNNGNNDKENEKEKQRSNSMDNKTRNKNHNQQPQRHQSSQHMSFRNTRVNYKSSLVKEEAQCNGCIVY